MRRCFSVLLATLSSVPAANVYADCRAVESDAEAVQVTRFGGINSNGRWSRDGNWIVFDSQRRPDVPHNHSSRTIRIVDSNGRNERVLTNARRDQAPSFSPDGSRIVFESYRTGSSQMFVMNRDGSEQRQLTNSAGYHSSGDFSPDGKRILWFHGATYDEADPWLMNADGSDARRLFSTPGSDTYPSWSPDGRRIVFTSHRDGNAELYLYDVERGSQTRLTNHPAADDHARWSPDGKRVAFVSWRDGANGIYVLDVDTRAVRAVPVPHSNAHLPDWSPDGDWLLYHARTPEGTELFRVRAATACSPAASAMNSEARLRRVTQSTANEWHPAPSQDGLHLAFVSDAVADDWGDDAIHLHVLATGASGRMRRSRADLRPDWSSTTGELLFVTSTRDETPQICSSRPDGRRTVCHALVPSLRSTPRLSPDQKSIVYGGERPDGTATLFVLDLASRATREIDTGGSASNPAWSPDGARIVFSSDRAGTRDLWVIDSAGGDPQPLTSGAGTDDLPSWSPDGKQIAFVRESGGNWDVMTVPVSGGEGANVSNHPAFDTQPAWAPDSRTLYFASKRDGNMNIYAAAVAGDKPARFR